MRGGEALLLRSDWLFQYCQPEKHSFPAVSFCNFHKLKVNILKLVYSSCSVKMIPML